MLGGGDYTQPGSSVKNHTFFPTILYSLGGMVYFFAQISSRFSFDLYQLTAPGNP